jgi:hypothetical protein
MGAPAPELPKSHGMDMGLTGLDKEAQAVSDLALKKEKIAKDQENFAIMHQQHYQDETKRLTEERSGLLKDYNEQKVDRNRYWSSLSSGQKVRNIVGILLSGFGTNMVARSIDKAIDDDVELQKESIGQKKSLLDENLRKFNDIKTAMDMTKVMQADIIGAQLDQAAAQAASPIAKAKAMQAKAELMAKYQPLADKVAEKQAIMKSISKAGSKSDPATLVQFLPEHVQPKVFAEISNAKEAARIEGDVMSTFDAMDKENTAFGKLTPGTPPSVLKYEALIGPMIRDQEGKPNEAERNTLLGLKPEPFDKPETVKDKKEGLRVFLQNKRQADTAKGYGIDLDKFESTARNPVMRMTPQEQNFYAWAKRNPNAAEAQQFMQKHGLRN